MGSWNRQAAIARSYCKQVKGFLSGAFFAGPPTDRQPREAYLYAETTLKTTYHPPAFVMVPWLAPNSQR